MKLPGFTADVSLYTTEERYQTVKMTSQVEGAIQPALFRGRGCMPNCIAQCQDDPFCYDNCRCICFGHPGRTCWLQ